MLLTNNNFFDRWQCVKTFLCAAVKRQTMTAWMLAGNFAFLTMRDCMTGQNPQGSASKELLILPFDWLEMITSVFWLVLFKILKCFNGYPFSESRQIRAFLIDPIRKLIMEFLTNQTANIFGIIPNGPVSACCIICVDMSWRLFLNGCRNRMSRLFDVFRSQL